MPQSAPFGYTRTVSEERVQKVLAAAGVASRRKAEDLIRAGRVQVNGQKVELGATVGPADRITVDGKPVARQAAKVTYMLNKPPGYLSAASDRHGRKTVLELVPKVDGLHPVGRLDLESEGLLLLTNDGDLTLKLTHPRYGKEKEYRVWCSQGALNERALQQLRDGVQLEDGLARVKSVARAEGGCRLVITEGRKRQVRLMLRAVGYDVDRLLRLRVGNLRLGDLPEGKWRKLSGDETDALRR